MANLVFNPGFERGDVVGWKVVALTTGTVNNFTASTVDKHSGNYGGYLNITGAFGTSIHVQVEVDDPYRIPVIGGVTYEIGMWVKGLGPALAGSPNVNVQWYDSNGTFISKVQLGNGATSGSGWFLEGQNLVALTAQAPSNAAYATVMFDIQSSTATSFYLDDAYINGRSFITFGP